MGRFLQPCGWTCGGLQNQHNIWSYSAFKGAISGIFIIPEQKTDIIYLKGMMADLINTNESTISLPGAEITAFSKITL